MNQIGIMTWEDCYNCTNKCTKSVDYFIITPEYVFCRNHSKMVIATVGIVDMNVVRVNCKLFSVFFKTCILNMVYEFEPVKQLLTNT